MLQITYGAPTYRLNLLKETGSWTIKLHVIGQSKEALVITYLKFEGVFSF